VTNYIIASDAMKDLEAIMDYFSAYSVALGEKFLIQFEQKCSYLVQFPQIGRSYKTIRPYLRGLPLEGYIIFYRLKNYGIEIMRVVKGNRNFDSMFPEDN
jgi:toxin ParE1/3/4